MTHTKEPKLHMIKIPNNCVDCSFAFDFVEGTLECAMTDKRVDEYTNSRHPDCKFRSKNKILNDRAPYWRRKK